MKRFFEEHIDFCEGTYPDGDDLVVIKEELEDYFPNESVFEEYNGNEMDEHYSTMQMVPSKMVPTEDDSKNQDQAPRPRMTCGKVVSKRKKVAHAPCLNQVKMKPTKRIKTGETSLPNKDIFEQNDFLKYTYVENEETIECEYHYFSFLLSDQCRRLDRCNVPVVKDKSKLIKGFLRSEIHQRPECIKALRLIFHEESEKLKSMQNKFLNPNSTQECTSQPIDRVNTKENATPAPTKDAHDNVGTCVSSISNKPKVFSEKHPLTLVTTNSPKASIQSASCTYTKPNTNGFSVKPGLQHPRKRRPKIKGSRKKLRAILPNQDIPSAVPEIGKSTVIPLIVQNSINKTDTQPQYLLMKDIANPAASKLFLIKNIRTTSRLPATITRIESPLEKPLKLEVTPKVEHVAPLEEEPVVHSISDQCEDDWSKPVDFFETPIPNETVDVTPVKNEIFFPEFAECEEKLDNANTRIPLLNEIVSSVNQEVMRLIRKNGNNTLSEHSKQGLILIKEGLEIMQRWSQSKFVQIPENQMKETNDINLSDEEERIKYHERRLNMLMQETKPRKQRKVKKDIKMIGQRYREMDSLTPAPFIRQRESLSTKSWSEQSR